MTNQRIESQPESVLLVEDDDACRSSVTLLLEIVGFQVIPVEDGGSAIESFQERGAEVGVVLLDVVLPGLSGYETLCELRRMRDDLPVVLTSGYDKQRIFRDFAELKFEGFISKPATLDILRDTLKPFINP